MARIISESVALAVFNYDDVQASEIMTGFAHVEGLVFSEISVDGEVFTQFGDMEARTDDASAAERETGTLAISPERVTYSHPISYRNDIGIGVLTISYSTLPVQAALARNQKAALLAQVLSFSCLGIVLVVSLRRVTRPLREITQVIDDVTAGQLDRGVPYLDRKDEVGLLARAVSLFQKNAHELVTVQAEAEANRLVAEMAAVDELTGLPNRRGLVELFERLETTHCTDRAAGIALIHMDLDGFKQINDTLGHKAGDSVLAVVSAVLRSVGHDCELVARIGGDEFVAVLTGREDLRQRSRDLADTLIRRIREPSSYEGQTVRVGCSAGIAYHSPENADLFETLVQADIALYKAKNNGKNGWVEFDDFQRKSLIQKKALSDQIQSGIERDEFLPYFQPIVDAQTGEIISLEVLARWNNPQLGLVGPPGFLELARELKLLRFIDRTILEKAIAAMRSLSGELDVPPQLSVNVSVERLVESDLLAVARSLEKTPIRLNIELLESAYIDDISDTLGWHLDALKELGVGIHIDNFGTGHSSLAGLLRVAPDCIKIDRRFVAAAPHSDKERALIKSMIGIAKAFRIKTVCEGIETEDQAELVRAMGCEMLQGRLFFHEMDEADLSRALLGHRSTRVS